MNVIQRLQSFRLGISLFIGVQVSFALAAFPFSRQSQGYDPTDDILSFFGDRCGGTYGAISAPAYVQSKGLGSIVQKILNDDACEGLVDALRNIQLATDATLASTRAEIDHNRLRTEVDNLQAAYASEYSKSVTGKTTVDPNYLSALSFELSRKSVAYIQNKSSARFLDSYTRLDTIGNFDNYLDSLFSELKRQSACTQKHPGIVAEIGAQMLALSGNLVSGVTGSIMMVSGKLSDHLIDYARTYDVGRSLRAVNQNSMAFAVECGIESIASTFCEARDVRLLAEAHVSTRIPEDLDGVRIIGSSSSGYLIWLSELILGSRASGPAAGNEKKSANQLETDFNNTVIDLDALISKSETRLGQPDTNHSKELESLVKGLHNVITKAVQTTTYVGNTAEVKEGPFGKSFSEDPYCGPLTYFYSKGAQRACPLENSTQTCLSCVKKKLGIESPPAIGEIQGLKDRIVNESRGFVLSETSIFKESNPPLILAKVNSEGENFSTAREFLLETQGYFLKLIKLPGYADPKSLQRRLLNKALEKIAFARLILEDPSDTDAPKPNPDPAQSLMRKGPSDDARALAQILAPANDTYYLSNVLNQVTKRQLDQKLKDGEINAKLALALLVSVDQQSADSLASFTRVAVGKQRVKDQSVSAKSLAFKNLANFTDVFSKYIKATLTQMKKSAETNAFDRESLSKLCVKLAAIGNAPKLSAWFDLRNYCKGAMYTSQTGKHMALKFDDIIELPAEERVCKYYDFARKSRFLELNGMSGAR